MIEVVVDDLAFVEADAILRPADDTLAPLTPAMKRLDLQAGARFATLCQVQSPLDAGAAVVTGGGDLRRHWSCTSCSRMPMARAAAR